MLGNFSQKPIRSSEQVVQLRPDEIVLADVDERIKTYVEEREENCDVVNFQIPHAGNDRQQVIDGVRQPANDKQDSHRKHRLDNVELRAM